MCVCVIIYKIQLLTLCPTYRKHCQIHVVTPTKTDQLLAERRKTSFQVLWQLGCSLNVNILLLLSGIEQERIKCTETEDKKCISVSV